VIVIVDGEKEFAVPTVIVTSAFTSNENITAKIANEIIKNIFIFEPFIIFKTE